MEKNEEKNDFVEKVEQNNLQKIKIIIELDVESKKVQVSAPLQNKQLCMKMIGIAMNMVANHGEKNKIIEVIN